MGQCSGRLGDGGASEIGSHRDRRRHTEERDEQRRHDRAASHAGKADHHANAKTCSGKQPEVAEAGHRI